MKRVYRLIAPKWLREQGATPVMEGEYTLEQVLDFNAEGYNCYTVPNHPTTYHAGTALTGGVIDAFDYVFVDCDLKDGIYPSKLAFIERLGEFELTPTRIVDSGNGVHAYWKVTDLDPMSYLRLSKRLMRLLKTDEAVGQIFQLMRVPGTYNTKYEDNIVLCEVVHESGLTYTCEELDKVLPSITREDETKCQQHFHKTYNTNKEGVKIDEKLPARFGKLLRESPEAKAIWSGEDSDDRSKNDFRLGHVMFANGFTRQEALSVLVNSAKALQRAPIHRESYAENIVDKIWTYELAEEGSPELAISVKDILQRSGTTLKGTRFPCSPMIDNTEKGFRLGQVIGLVAGVGVGKSAFALNMFKWFAELNPDYHHFFVPLEQPANEIAERWQTMCGANTSLHDKVHVLSNYDEESNFRHLSLDEIQDYIIDWQKRSGKKVGCVVIDHIGVLKKKNVKDENQGLVEICHAMKAFAVKTNTLLVMQSQTSREKAGIGDLELNKDAAYGTIFFEAYCDYLITMWQPLKRMHASNAPTVTAFKFCKIRHKKAKRDLIQEDVPYYLYFDSDSELLREMTQDDKTAFDYFLGQATNKRKADRKTELVKYQSVPSAKEGTKKDEQSNNSGHSNRH